MMTMLELMMYCKEHTSYLGFEEVFGIKTKRENEELISFEKTFSFNEALNIEDFKEFKRFYENAYSNEWKDGNYIEYAKEFPEIAYYSKSGKKYRLDDFFFSLDENIRTEEPVWYIPDDEVAFCFTGIEFKYNTVRKPFKSYYYTGFVFYK